MSSALYLGVFCDATARTIGPEAPVAVMTVKIMDGEPKVWAIAPSRVLSWLCHYANADPMGREFYQLKERLLRKYATFWGHDIQEITKECWGDQWHSRYGYWYGCGPKCSKCGGTGVFDRRWVRLQRWHWNGYVFHVPDDSTRVKPESVQIVGLVKHPNYGRASREAELWLYLLTLELRTFWYLFTSRSYCNGGLWPLVRMQRVAMRLRMWLQWRKCWCGRWYPTWGSGWCVCRKCRNTYADDVPF